MWFQRIQRKWYFLHIPAQVVQMWVVIILRNACICMRPDLKSRSGPLTRWSVTWIVFPSLYFSLRFRHIWSMMVIIDQVCRKRSRSIWIMVQVRGPGRYSNLVKNMLTCFFEGPLPGNFGFKISPLSRNSAVEERNRPGQEGVAWTRVEKISPANHLDCFSLVNSNIMRCDTGWRTTFILIFLQLKWLSCLIWGEKCSKIP